MKEKFYATNGIQYGIYDHIEEFEKDLVNFNKRFGEIRLYKAKNIKSQLMTFVRSYQGE